MQKSLNVLFVISKMSKGGAQRFVVELANSLVEVGCHADLLIFFRTPQDQSLLNELDTRVRVISLTNKAVRLPSAYAAIFKRFLFLLLLPLRTFIWVANGYLETYDVVHSHLISASFFSWLADRIIRLLRKNRPRFVETFHSDTLIISQVEKQLFFLLWKHLDALILHIRKDDVQTITAKLPDTPVHYILFGISPPKIPDEIDVIRFRHIHRIVEGVPCIVTISRMNIQEKCIDKLIDAVRFLKERHNSIFQYILCGDGPDIDRITSLISNSGLQNNVIRTGLIDNPYIPLCMADVFLVTGIEGIVGIAGLEAASMGIPVVSYQINPDWMDRGEFFLSTNSVKEIAQIIHTLITNESYHQQISQRSLDLFYSIFSRASMRNAYINLYTEFMGNE